MVFFPAKKAQDVRWAMVMGLSFVIPAKRPVSLLRGLLLQALHVAISIIYVRSWYLLQSSSQQLVSNVESGRERMWRIVRVRIAYIQLTTSVELGGKITQKFYGFLPPSSMLVVSTGGMQINLGLNWSPSKMSRPPETVGHNERPKRPWLYVRIFWGTSITTDFKKNHVELFLHIFQSQSSFYEYSPYHHQGLLSKSERIISHVL